MCEIGPAPGAPEVWITDGPVGPPPAVVPPSGSLGVSNSRYASFTYNAKDNVDTIIDIVFECRFDAPSDPTEADLLWDDCEFPQEYANLQPGRHTFEIRAIDKQLFASMPVAPTSKYTWTYVPLPANVAPVTEITMGPGERDMNNQLVLGPDGHPQTWLPEGIFTYEANEPDVLFECAVDFPLFPYEPCSFDESIVPVPYAGWEVALEDTQFGLHTFYVRATDWEGNVGQPDTYTWRLLGIMTMFTSGPGFTPPETPFDPPTGGPSTSRTAIIDFEANVDGADFECSLDLGPFEPCMPPVTYTQPADRRPQPARDRDRGRDDGGRGRRVRVGGRRAAEQRAAGHLHRAEARERLQRHDLRVHRPRRRHARPACSRTSAASTARTTPTGRAAGTCLAA